MQVTTLQCQDTCSQARLSVNALRLAVGFLHPLQHSGLAFCSVSIHATRLAAAVVEALKLAVAVVCGVHVALASAWDGGVHLYLA